MAVTPDGDFSLLAPEPVAGTAAPAGGTVSTMAVVIAAYDASGTIAETLRSVLAQTLPPDEIVVCDDESPDGDALRQVLSAFGNRVRLVSVPHGGESRAKNAAVAATTSDVVCILDADDTWEPERLASIRAAFDRRPDLALVTTDAWHEREGRIVVRHYAANAFAVDDQRTAILRSNFVFGHVAVRRSAWDDIGGFREGLLVGADWDCWLRLLFRDHRAGLVDAPLVHYRLSPHSLSGDRARTFAYTALVMRTALREQLLEPAQVELALDRQRHWERRATLARAEVALRTQAPNARRCALAVVAAAGVPTATRAKHLVAAALPGLAARRLGRP